MKENADNEIRRKLLPFLNSGCATDSGWSIMSPRLNSLDDLSPFETMMLPLAYDRWKSDGRQVDTFPIFRGIYRKTLVRNRLFVSQRDRIMTSLRAGGVDAVIFKGGALIGTFLPERGIRAISDIDLWVRPSHLDKALSILGSKHHRLKHGLHALAVNIPSGLQVDVHVWPSNLFSLRNRSWYDAEIAFSNVWLRSTQGVPHAAELLYLSFVNPLYSHAPGEPRAAFALIELDLAINSWRASDEILSEIGKRIAQDKTGAIFLEHMNWLGRGASKSIDRFTDLALSPALTSEDIGLVDWLAAVRPSSDLIGDDANFVHGAIRKYALAIRRPLTARLHRALAIVHHILPTVRRDPTLLSNWVRRMRSWRRLRKLVFAAFSGR